MAKKRRKKERSKFSEFIRTTVKEHIMTHKDEIRKMCSEYTEIEEMPQEYWKQLDTIVLEIFMKAADAKETDHYFRMTYANRLVPYSLACKVREKQFREYIVNWIDRIVTDDDDWNVYCCYQVYSHIAIMLSENSKQEKTEKKSAD